MDDIWRMLWLNHVQAYFFRFNCAKSSDGFQKGVIALTSLTKVHARTKKEKAVKAFILNPDSNPLKHTMKKVIAIHGYQMTGLLASSLTTLRLQLLDGHARELILDGGTLFKSCHLTHMSWTLAAVTQQSKVWAWSQHWHVILDILAHNTILPRSIHSISPHRFRGGLTFHRRNEKSRLTSLWYTCLVPLTQLP